MKEYFKTHENEKELVLVKLNRISKALKMHELTIPKEIPEYLIPSFIKEDLDSWFNKLWIKRENSIKSNAGINNSKTVIRSWFIENPIITDAKQLWTFSSHKLWKIKHKKIWKFQDKKKTRKGIYNI